VLQLELLALRHQLAVSERTSARPVLQPADRLLKLSRTFRNPHV
jgi:hypothetical protein